ncbi:MAG: tRNA epoxyqueuosine(34) reductase QueG, partial [Opitutae bacterium]|nr:tRNA epoxyqueuosine(34) reductase QueG [Opitutae bacterium]
MPAPPSLTQQCREEALRLGFDLCGFAPIEVKLRKDYFRRWIEEGRHGTMTWMERNNDRRLNPAKIIPQARSIVMGG